MVAVVATLCFVNIVLWIIFLIRFKKLFSTDKIIENTSEKMNKLVAEIDKTTKRDLFLSSESTKKMQALLKEADEKMVLFKEATQRLRDMIAESDKVTRRPVSQNPIYGEIPEVKKQQNTDRTSPSYRRNIDSYMKNSNKTQNINPDSSYEITKNQQPELFDQDNYSKVHDTPMQVTQNGAAYKEVPLIITKVYDEKPENPDKKNKKNLSKQVQELYNNGLSVEDIANELSCSITEVQLIIDMYG